MTSARKVLAEALKLKLPRNRYRFITSATIPDNITRPTLVIYQQNARRFDQIGHDRLLLNLTLGLLVAGEDPDKAEDKLEECFGEIVEALTDIDWAVWDEAVRDTWGRAGGPTFHAYMFNLTSINKIGA